MADALSDRTIEIVKSTAPPWSSPAPQLPAYRMYRTAVRMAELAYLFKTDRTMAKPGPNRRRWPRRSLRMPCNIDISAYWIPRRAHRAETCGFEHIPSHYPFVAGSALGAIKDVLGDLATEDVLSASWGEAHLFPG